MQLVSRLRQKEKNIFVRQIQLVVYYLEIFYIINARKKSFSPFFLVVYNSIFFVSLCAIHHFLDGVIGVYLPVFFSAYVSCFLSSFYFLLMSNVFVLSKGRMTETKSTKKTLLNTHTHNRWIERKKKSIHVCVRVCYTTPRFFLFCFYSRFFSQRLVRQKRRREPWKYAHRSIIHAIVNMMTGVTEEKKKGRRKRRSFSVKERKRREHNYCAVQSWPCHQQARRAVLQKRACLFSFFQLCSDRVGERKKKEELSWTSSSWESTGEKRTSKQAAYSSRFLCLSWWFSFVRAKYVHSRPKGSSTRIFLLSQAPLPFFYEHPLLLAISPYVFFHHIFFRED